MNHRTVKTLSKKREKTMAPKRRVSMLRTKKNHVKSATMRRGRRMLNGIPLKRRVVWVYDTDSAEFKAAWKKERKILRNSRSDPDIDEFLDAAARDTEYSLDGA